ncbi:MAG TPA: LacI family DNA-binding transcriptional regulator [Bacteroidales bacterium]|nr:LacI family DNA-binding transcriptional regulator [Bacteroidales bacterium]HPT22450.1 LacI family DNA-binding transcriptional regulator [Bacteroidales bacterium]
MTSKKARIKDIAELAGVSIGTVDRVLHKRGEVAEETRLKIENILRENNYTPNVMAQVLKSKKRFHFVSLLPRSTEDNSFWQKHPLGMTRAIEELNPFPVTLSQVTFNMSSEKDFQKKAARVLDLNPDGVLLAPIFKTESTVFCSQLSEKNIPFVFVDGFLENTGFLAYIGEDIFQSGRVAGQLIDIVSSEKSDILVVNIAKNLRNVHHLNSRTQGFMSYFNESPGKKGKISIINIPDSSPESIKAAIDKEFEESSCIESIFITGSKSYLIASYLEKKGLGSIHLIGYDLLDMNVKYLKSGTTRFLIGQRPEEQTYKGIKKLFDFLSLNKIPEKIEYLPVDIVTSENVDFFI